MKKDRVIELLEEQNRHFKEQIKAADKREQQSQRLICELTSQLKQLTDAVQSLEEAEERSHRRGVCKLLQG